MMWLLEVRHLGPHGGLAGWTPYLLGYLPITDLCQHPHRRQAKSAVCIACAGCLCAFALHGRYMSTAALITHGWWGQLAEKTGVSMEHRYSSGQ